ncbi:MAG: hypothetical protein ACI9EF_001914 [Pseudohongiellaceae bacterium]|jgi:hypothetical protein
MTQPSHHPTDFVRGFVRRIEADQRMQYVWLEGDDDTILWPPYRTLDLHLGVPEPDVEAVRQELAALFGSVDEISDFSQFDAPLKGWAGTARLSDGTALTYRIERTSQLAKVPRRVVNVLIDHSGGLLLSSFSYETPNET